MENYKNNNNTNHTNKNNITGTEKESESKSRESKMANPEEAVPTTAEANGPHTTEGMERKGPTIKNISGLDRKVVLAKRPGPACKTRRKVTTTPSQEDNDEPSTSSAGVKRPVSPDDSEETTKRRVVRDEEEMVEVSSVDSGDEYVPEVPLPSQGMPGPTGPKKRGRGRPAISGQYVGLAKAKAKLLEQEERELQLRAEKELLEQEAVRRETRLLLAHSLRNKEDCDPEEGEEDRPRRKVLLQEAIDGAQTVLDVAKKSGNLKGTMVKLLRQAAEGVITASKELASITAEGEVKALEGENEDLKKKVSRMEGEVEALKREMWLSSFAPRVATTTPDPPEGGPSTPSVLAENSGRAAALKLLKERREKKGIKKGKADAKRSEPPPAFPPPPPMEEQGERMEVEETGRALQSLNIAGEGAMGAGETKTATTGAAVTPELEVMMGNLVRQFGNMMAARFAAIEDRLLPEKIIRPPLQADRKKEEKLAPEKTGPNNRPAVEEKSKREKRADKKEKGSLNSKETPKTSAKVEKRTTTRASPPVPTTSQSYAEAARKGRKGTAGGTAKESRPDPPKDGSPATARASSTHQKVDGFSPSGEGPSKKGGKGRRKTAAVVVTIRPLPAVEGEQPTAPTLTAIMQEATNKVDLKELGIEYLRPKRAKTGGLILEIPGEESAPKADRLAERLREAIGNKEEVQITRPTWTAELRQYIGPR